MTDPTLVADGWTVRRAAVIGAGTMGAQIAALLAGFGIECELLDLPEDAPRTPALTPGRGTSERDAKGVRFDPDPSPGIRRAGRDARAAAALERLAAMRPSPLFARDDLDRIRPGNVADHRARLADCDWVIEAVFEDLDVKRRIWAQLAPHLRADAIASTNTSGIPITEIAAALPAHVRPRFLGAHFFNPPRYLRLFELIPTRETAPAVTAAVQRFGSETLGKGCVVAHDVPGFVGNRIGLYVLAETVRAMLELGLGPDEVDSVTGPPLGRPRSATFRTLDLIGLDVYVDICDKLRATVPEPWEQEAFAVPAFLREMVARGWLGDKTRQGFYRAVQVDGRREFHVLDPATLAYRPQRVLAAPSLLATRRIEDSGARIAALAASDDAAGMLAWRILSRLFAFAAAKVPEVAPEIASIDNAMRWGFAWSLGPFETWEAMGIAETADRMEHDGLATPPWVKALAQQGGPFYRHAAQGTEQATPHSTYTHVGGSERTVSLPWLQAQAETVVANPSATLRDLGDGIAFLDVHGAKQTIDADVLDMLAIAAERTPAGFTGLVLSSHVQPHFCVGANLAVILQAAQDKQWEAIEAFIHKLQYGLLALKRMPVPFVTALYGRALGGGLELGLAAHRVVAARESYVGLVETAVGLVPAGGGCKELLLRMPVAREEDKTDSRVRGNDGSSRSGSPSGLTQAVRRAFETIRLGKVSQHAPDAVASGYLRADDIIEANPDHLLYRAKAAALALAADGDSTRSAPVQLPVLGAAAREGLVAPVADAVDAGRATAHDLRIARTLACILTGGDAPTGAQVDEEHIIDLERAAFVSLCGEPKTQDRVAHLLKTGKPLRN